MTTPVRSWPWRLGQAGMEGQTFGSLAWLSGAGRGALALAAAALVIGVVELVISDPKTLFWDFRNAYYRAGTAVLHGAPLAPLIHKGIWGFVNLPLLAWLFAPFALLPAKLAAVIFTGLSLVVLAIAYLLLAELANLNGLGRAWLLLAMAANGPLIYSLKLGNASHLVLPMLAGGLWLLRRERRVAAGVLLGLAALVKLPLLLFGLYFLLRRKGQAAFGFFGLIVAAFALSVLIFGLPLHVEWYQDAIRTFNTDTLAAFNVQSFQSFMLRLHEPPPPLADWRLYLPGPGMRLTSLYITLILYAVMIWCCLRQPHDRRTSPDARTDEREYLAVTVLCLITSPLSWTHYYCWLLLPAAFLIRDFVQGRRLAWIAAFALLLAMPPVLLLTPASPILAALYEKLLVSSYLFGGVLWFGLLTLASCPGKPRGDNRNASF